MWTCRRIFELTQREQENQEAHRSMTEQLEGYTRIIAQTQVSGVNHHRVCESSCGGQLDAEKAEPGDNTTLFVDFWMCRDHLNEQLEGVMQMLTLQTEQRPEDNQPVIRSLLCAPDIKPAIGEGERKCTASNQFSTGDDSDA